MRLNGAILAVIQFIEVYSASKIFSPSADDPLTVAAVNIVNRCFWSTESWSEVVIMPSQDSGAMLERIHHESKTSNLIVFPDNEHEDELKQYGKFNEYSNTDVKWQKTEPNAAFITTHGSKHLKSVLSFLKLNRRIWRPRSFFLIVLETRCDLDTCNNMFKVMWEFWILNAVIVCSSDIPTNGNESEIQLYTFNPYSADHSPQWKSVIHEMVEVSMHSGNFNHSWYIFKQRFAEIISAAECGDLFFDKTSNLDGYVIPSGYNNPKFLTNKIKLGLAKLFASDGRVLKTLSQSLHFKVVQVYYKAPEEYGQLFENGSYSGMLNHVYTGRSQLVAPRRAMDFYPGLEITYPHETSGPCFVSRIVGNRPPWKNLADAKHIWTALGLGLIFSTVVLYLQNKSHGIMSAFFEAQRLIVGSSIIRTSTLAKHRFILGSIFLVVLIIDGAIRGRFISILTIARPYPNLDTTQQVKEQNIDIYGHSIMKGSISDPEISSRFSSSHDIVECVNSLKKNEDHRVCFVECRAARFMSLNSTILHASPTLAMTYHVTYLTTMYWPIKDRYSSGVHRLVEAGIIEQWHYEIYREFEISSWKYKRAVEPPYVKPTQLNDLVPAFILLFVVLSLALTVFALELLASSKYFRCVGS